jgi:uncharacterized protein (DUF3820 family)
MGKRSKVLDQKAKLWFGKYKGELLEDVIRKDVSYVRWCYDQEMIELSAEYRELIKVKCDDDGVQCEHDEHTAMPIGKYKGKTVGELVEEDPAYLVWALENKLLDVRDSLVRLIFDRLQASFHSKETVFWFGLYKDLTVEEVLKSNPRYIKWCIDHEILRLDDELRKEVTNLYAASFRKKLRSKE